MRTRVLLLGATGLVGSELLRRIEYDQRFTTSVIARRPPDKIVAAQVRWTIGSLSKIDSLAPSFSVDTVVCAIGTTRRKAGSEEAFRKIDHDMAVDAARMAKQQEVSQFILVSAAGADPDSRIFYNRVKGETERDVARVGPKNLAILRPSLLLGERREFRAGEVFGQLLSPFAPRKWKGVPVEAVATTIVDQILNPPSGVRVIENTAILARSAVATYR